MDPALVFQAWCRRDPTELFQAWREGSEGVYTYAPRWATEVCADRSSWHAALLHHFLELPLQEAYVGQLRQEGIQRAITQCDDPQAVAWLRSGLDTDLAPATHQLMVRMALGLNRPEWDTLVVAISANERRNDALRVQAFELYVFERFEIADAPALIADAYVAERIPPGFASKWVPMLLARPETRADMVVRGLDALAANPRWELTGGELPFVLLAEMGAYSYRFSEPLARRGDEAIRQLMQLPGASYSFRDALRRAEAARRDSLNADGRRVRRVTWDFTTTMTDGACVPNWPDHLREFGETTAAELRVMIRGNRCVEPEATGDFDANGYDDVLVAAVLEDRDSFVLILAGETPRLLRVSDAGPFHSGSRVDPGWIAAGCVEELGWMPWDGFTIGFNETTSTHYYVRDGQLVSIPGSSC